MYLRVIDCLEYFDFGEYFDFCFIKVIYKNGKVIVNIKECVILSGCEELE